MLQATLALFVAGGLIGSLVTFLWGLTKIAKAAGMLE